MKIAIAVIRNIKGGQKVLMFNSLSFAARISTPNTAIATPFLSSMGA